MSEEIRIIETGDGSQSLYNPRLRETYHSTHGALTESDHVFIQMGLVHCINEGKQHISLLEVGLGTGLNALLTTTYARTHPEIEIDYHSLEPFPLKEDIISQLKFPELLDAKESISDFNLIHNNKWREQVDIASNFCFTRYQQKVEDISFKDQFDLVYFDAFAPNKQAEVWKVSVLGTVYESMKSDGVLVTYCAKGQFKRDLVALAFKVETLDGPPGKKEMVRATK